jgi:hypothetical protein
MALGDDPTMYRDHVVWSRDGRFNMLVPPEAAGQIQVSFDPSDLPCMLVVQWSDARIQICPVSFGFVPRRVSSDCTMANHLGHRRHAKSLSQDSGWGKLTGQVINSDPPVDQPALEEFTLGRFPVHPWHRRQSQLQP